MTRLMAVSVAVVALTACGPGAKLGGGKEGAAAALFAASAPSSKTSTGSGIDIPGSTVSFSCPEGGSATMSGFSVNTNILGGSADVSTKINIAYNGCGLAKDADVGVAIYNGNLTLEQSIMAGAGAANLSQKFTGKVLVQGAFDDFIDANVTQQVSANAHSATGAAVAVILKGSITTSRDSFTFDESINVTSGQIKAEITTKK